MEEIYSKLLTDYSTYILVERRLSKKTLDVYKRVVELFLNYITNNNISLNQVSVEHIENYVATFECLDAKTKSKYFSAIRSFFEFLVENDFRKDNPSELLTKIKTKNHPIEVHTREEIDTLLDYISKTSTEYSIRDRAIYELIYSAALRVSEVVNLKLGDYLKNEGVLRINNSKRGKSRIVPIGKRAIALTDEYLLSSRNHLVKKNSTDTLFLSRFGAPLTRLEIWKQLDKYGEAIGIHFTVHSLRHSYATHMLQNGASLVALQALLGHSNLKTTEVYTHLDDTDLRREFFEHK